MKTIYEILEVDKVLLKLSNFADSDDGKALCVNLKKIDNKDTLIKAINETDAAVSYLKQSNGPTFNKITNINESMLRLSKEATLNTIELLNISYLLDSADRAIAFRESKEFNTCLDTSLQKGGRILNQLNNAAAAYDGDSGKMSVSPELLKRISNMENKLTEMEYSQQ